MQRPGMLAVLTSAISLILLSLVQPAWLAGQAVPADDLSAFSGLYTYPPDPDTPLTFYVQDGKLVAETERMVPTELRQYSGTSFEVPESKTNYSFTLDASGHGATVVSSTDPDQTYQRTGEPVHHVFHDYRRSEVMIPMRDGIHLHAVILQPTDITTPLPLLLLRTPYGVDGTDRASFFRDRPELARAGYIYVCEDIRGRYKSEGTFRMMRPLVSHAPGTPKTEIDESTDTYDTVDWLLHHVSGNNGRVGLVGESYAGFLTIMGGIDPNPAVKAISPQAPMIDVWLGDDYFHNGAFRASFGYDYVEAIESGKGFLDVSYANDPDGKPVDGFNFFLDRGSFAGAVEQSGSKMLPTWKLFLDHPAYDGQWKALGVEYSLRSVAVPTLSVGGTYDQEDMYGPQEEYATLERYDTRHQNFLVLAPWRHGYWSSSSRHLGNLDYTVPVGRDFRERFEAPFFAYYLKDQPGFNVKDTACFQTGSNRWMFYSHFPPLQAHPMKLYLLGNGSLGWAPSHTRALTSYVSDPGNPVPYRYRPIQPTYSKGSQWYNWLTEDQRFVTGRKDIAVWKLPVLKSNLTLTGEVVADIFAATTGTDNDLVVKLIDQYPDDDPDPKMRGYQLMINEEIFRGRYLHSFSNPVALPAGAAQEYKFSLHDVDHVFLPKHRVMVEIQSSWFPLYDRNPQTFVPNIMTAQPGDYRATTISVYSGPLYNSALDLPVCSKGCR
jgi:hypothetical protein